MKTPNKTIEKRNELFKQASKAEKRVLIAKDVIAQIEANRFKPMFGEWLDFDAYNLDNWDVGFREEFFNKTIKKCDGCALGGLMLSCTLYKNKMSIEDMRYLNMGDSIGEYNYEKPEPLKNGLNNIFSPAQLRLIEMTFEGGRGAIGIQNCGASEETMTAALKFSRKYRSAKGRLVAIMENIIKNNGEFLP